MVALTFALTEPVADVDGGNLAVSEIYGKCLVGGENHQLVSPYKAGVDLGNGWQMGYGLLAFSYGLLTVEDKDFARAI